MRTVFQVDVRPRGKGRPRFYGGHACTDAKTYAYEQAIKIAYMNSVSQHCRMHEGPLVVTLEANFMPPKSWSRKKQAIAASGGMAYTGKPDLDNIIKSLDAINGVAWHDDSQIIGIIGRKSYGPADRLVITIEEVEA